MFASRSALISASTSRTSSQIGLSRSSGRTILKNFLVLSLSPSPNFLFSHATIIIIIINAPLYMQFFIESVIPLGEMQLGACCFSFVCVCLCSFHINYYDDNNKKNQVVQLIDLYTLTHMPGRKKNKRPNTAGLLSLSSCGVRQSIYIQIGCRTERFRKNFFQNTRLIFYY